ncbi:DgyrCDS8574 [Dimorphilus gyrociliatus]|uniref:DgyrCDS8574 n=1 Tax=Dimorphilus gyrociliatus TaxID=2664684 RepID=A0A7I8VUH8_9ANNE|nr:DgyrCDS8574 [Dimorphilus gyrociliatus]
MKIMLNFVLVLINVPNVYLQDLLFTCDFESTFCNMVQDMTDATNSLFESGSFDWQRYTGKTPTSNTGPTTGDNQSKYYIYIETSDPQRSNDAARIFLPTLPFQEEICLEFSYHMNGSDMGTLNIITQAAIGRDSPKDIVWTRSGTQGNEWKEEKISVNGRRRIGFEGIKGPDFRSDIAIDNIKVSSGSCFQAPSISLPFTCNFEQNFCGMTARKTEIAPLNWLRWIGSTPTAATGPSAAESGQWYTFVEADGTRSGDKAIIETPLIARSSDVCIEFYYHMYGANQGSFLVYVQSKTQNRPIWQETGNKDNIWQIVRVPTTLSVSDKIGFVATVGNGRFSDIAMDSLRITNGACQTSGSSIPWSCNFENDLCSFNTFERNDYWRRHTGPTFTPNTGPSFAKGGRYFMYFEANSGPDRAGMQSPSFSYTGPVCANFYYHAYGANVGELTLWTQNRGPNDPWWKIVGNQGNIWINAQVQISLSGNDRVGLIARRGNGDQSDFAIDDFYLEPRECPSIALPWSCDVENGWCQLKNKIHSGVDQFDWTRTNKVSSIANTGPTRAQSGAWYLYVQADGRSAGDNALLETPVFNFVTSVCLSFHYNLNGVNVGSLVVYTRSQGSNNPSWESHGNQGNVWKKKSLTLVLASMDTIIFKAVMGNGIFGDIAIDNLNIRAGSCQNSQLPLLCGFETIGLCGMLQLKNDDFDWLRSTGSSPATNSGPQRAFAGNWYLLADSRARKAGDRANLETPIINHIGDICLSFYYMMYGSTVGHLTIYTEKRASGAYWWSKHGDQGNVWRPAQIDIRIEAQNDKILFDASANEGPSGDIAIDDLRIEQGRCLDNDNSGGSGLPFQCSFENTDLCGLVQSTSDDQNWIRISGPTPTSETGPDRSSDGQFYIYFRASAVNTNSARAIISTMPIRYSGDICIRMDYHMFGINMGQLFVSNNLQNLWSSTGDQGNSWRQANIESRISSGNSIRFTAVKGNGIFGDIAIDRLSITAGSCTTNTVRLPFQCTFEFDLCQMVQSKADNGDWQRINGPTPSDATGPDKAHSGNWYIFLNSRMFSFNDRIKIHTPAIDYDGAICLSFYYYMYGRDVKRLFVYGTAAGEMKPIFDRTNEQPRSWQSVEVDYAIKRDEQLVFVAERGSGIQSDIAVDSILINPNSCSGDRFSCDAENVGVSTSSQCYLSQIHTDDLQWLKGTGKTPSGKLFDRKINNVPIPVTGPTRAQQGSSYLYIEASKAGDGQVARLKLDGQVINSGGARCLRFWYCMNGYHINSLRVFQSDSITNFQRIQRWEISGDQKNLWKEAAVDLTLPSSGGNVEFEAATSGHYSGDIAIDNVIFTFGPCQASSTVTLWECKFEIGGNIATFCRMEQDKRDAFDWSLLSGETPSKMTGPNRAYNGEYYIFIEASKPRRRGDMAKILLPQLNTGGRGCLQFKYHMYGFHINELNVFTRIGSQDTIIWKKVGQQGNRWIGDQVNIETMSPNIRIGFTGIRGGEYSGDIALDDIQLLPGTCPT